MVKQVAPLDHSRKFSMIGLCSGHIASQTFITIYKSSLEQPSSSTEGGVTLKRRPRPRFSTHCIPLTLPLSLTMTYLVPLRHYYRGKRPPEQKMLKARSAISLTITLPSSGRRWFLTCLLGGTLQRLAMVTKLLTRFHVCSTNKIRMKKWSTPQAFVTTLILPKKS